MKAVAHKIESIVGHLDVVNTLKYMHAAFKERLFANEHVQGERKKAYMCRTIAENCAK